MTNRRVTLVVLFACAVTSPAFAQTPVADNWRDRNAAATSITVMIDAGAERSCLGAGFIVGTDGDSIYIVTAEHVIHQVRQRGPIANLGVRFRLQPADLRSEPFEERLAANVVQADADADLAALVVRSADFAERVRSRVDLGQAGDSAGLVQGDPVYSIGCGDGIEWDLASSFDTIRVPSDADGLISYASNYARPGASGGALVHLFSSIGTVVGMSLREKGGAGVAAPLHAILAKAATWKIPVQLRPPATTVGCHYDVSSRNVGLTGEQRFVEVSVNTDPDCEWGVTAQSDAELSERQGYWLEVYGPNGAHVLSGRYAASGKMLAVAGVSAPCDGRPQSANARVAGRLIRINYDGRCTTLAPPSKVGRNPDFIKPAAPLPPKKPLSAPALVRTAEAVAAARAAIEQAGNDGRFAASGWGCTLYGCRFFEGFSAAFCHPAVAKVELGDSAERFTLEVDRTPCGGETGERLLCHDAPHLPFAVAPGKVLFARVTFANQSTLVKRLPVSSNALEEIAAGRPFLGAFGGPENWTALESSESRGASPPPFAALAYGASGSGGQFVLFLGLRGCEGNKTTVSLNSWWIDQGSGLTRRMGHADGPPFPLGSFDPGVLAAASSTPVSLTIAADTESGRLGPYTYRGDLTPSVKAAIARVGAPTIVCTAVRPGRGAVTQLPTTSCRPGNALAWVQAKGVRLGPKDGEWLEELSFVLPATARAGDTRAPSSRTFNVRLPPDWAEVFYEVIGADGRALPVRQVPVR